MTKQRYTMSDIRTASRAAGSHFFDRAAMRFFDSRIESRAYNGIGGVYFITSEQFHGSNGYSAPRRYTVRQFDPADGDIGTVGEFNVLDLESARELARKCAAGTEAYKCNE